MGITDPRAWRCPWAGAATRGVGELVVALLDRGVRRFMIGLGGSSTNDGGSGLLAALGLRSPMRQGHALDPNPDGLARSRTSMPPTLDQRLAASEITHHVGRQQPAHRPAAAHGHLRTAERRRTAQVAQFDDDDRTQCHAGRIRARPQGGEQPGAGAAGGLGFALQVLGGTFASGAEVVAELVDLDGALRGARFGDHRRGPQGRTDVARQGAVRHCARGPHGHGVPVTLLSGAIDPAALPLLGQHFAGCSG